MHFTRTTFALLGLAAVGSSHVVMNTPKPFKESVTKNDNGPLDASGSDFPCKTSGTYTSQGMNTMALGSTQPLAFTGGAVHGGGSCQVSISYDTAPTKSSVWKVIHSIEGGCPMQNVALNQIGETATMPAGNYSFKVPTTLPTGTATLAWTWFNKIGNREMYMNCAPITLTSGTTKRDELIQRDQAAYSALPDMFKANIGNGCGTLDSTDLKFPNPGDSLEILTGSSTAPLADPTGNCATAVSGGSGSASTPASAPKSSATGAPVASSAPKVSSSPKASVSTLPGGVFATVPTTAKASVTAAPTGGSASTPVSAPVVSSTPAASKASSATTPASTGTTGSGTAMTAGTACTTEGMWNCIGGSSFQQCASGMWSTVQQMASGTTCTAGQSTTLKMAAIVPKPKRAVRFSRGHARRMAENS